MFHTIIVTHTVHRDGSMHHNESVVYVIPFLRYFVGVADKTEVN